MYELYLSKPRDAATGVGGPASPFKSNINCTFFILRWTQRNRGFHIYFLTDINSVYKKQQIAVFVNRKVTFFIYDFVNNNKKSND